MADDEADLARALERLEERDALRRERDALLVRVVTEPQREAELRAQVRAVTGRLEDYAGVEADVEHARRWGQIERVRAEDPVHGERRSAIAARLHVLGLKADVLQQAVAQATDAEEQLLRADERIRSAIGLGMMDVLADQTLVGRPDVWLDMGKRDRIDAAVNALGRAQSAVRLLSLKVGPALREARATVDVAGTLRALDTFVDDPISGLRTQLRLARAREQVRAIAGPVSELRAALQVELIGVEHELAELETEQTDLGR